MWISLANKCNIFVTLGLDCNRVDRSQNGTCNAELSSIKPESRESIQSKITEPACAEFSVTQVGNSAKPCFVFSMCFPLTITKSFKHEFLRERSYLQTFWLRYYALQEIDIQINRNNKTIHVGHYTFF